MRVESFWASQTMLKGNLSLSLGRKGSLILVLATLLVLLLTGKFLTHLLSYNLDTVSILKEALANGGQLASLSPETRARLSAYQDVFPCAAGGLSAWLAIQSDQLEQAFIPYDQLPCVRERFAVLDVSWKESNRLFTGVSAGWSPQRQAAVYSMFLKGIYEQRAGHLDAALSWFRKGLVLAPGRISDYARQQYYLALVEWYCAQGQDPQSQRLGAKALCLVDSDKDCLDAAHLDDFENWLLPSGNPFTTPEGWELVSLEIDRDVLALGVEVWGRLHWQRETLGQLEHISQEVLVPNLAPNPSFEIEASFRDNCVSGYVSSHLYVLPCTSHVVPDPYHDHSGQVAVIETQDDGFALFSSSFPVNSDSLYLVGSRLCADNGADALVGMDWIYINPGKTEAATVEWFFRQTTGESKSSCWQQHLYFVEPSASAEVCLRLQRQGLSGENMGRAMFEDLFFFEIQPLKAIQG